MNCKLLLSAAFASASLLATAQQQNTAYAITGKADNKFFWANIKEVDIATGNVIKTLFEADKTKFTTSYLNKSEAMEKATNPTAFGVAACALDARHNRLYFAPMHFSQIQYLDLSTSTTTNFTVVKKDIIKNVSATNIYQPEESQLTRMVIAADGYGYALTNDANHLIRFTTDKKSVVEDLGKIEDASGNTFSFHDKLAAWGGDMVADAFGKLVVISARHNVFSVDVNKKTAAFVGTISGLPEYYTTNGAAVNNDGNLIVSSANVFDGLYSVNMDDLKATKIESAEKTFNASDLANGNFLSQKKYDDIKNISLVNNTENVKTSRVFPNPVITNKFNVAFKNMDAGEYSVVLTSISGNSLQTNVVTLNQGETTKTITINQRPTRGFYLVKLINASKKTVSTERILIN